jgi:hypothetical protein
LSSFLLTAGNCARDGGGGDASGKILGRTQQEASVWVFEKKQAEKLHKPKKKETVCELLKNGVKHLEKLRHPRLLQVSHECIYRMRRKEMPRSLSRVFECLPHHVQLRESIH